MPKGIGTYGNKKGRPKNITVKGISLAGLSVSEQKAMKEHSKHHTAKHLKDMKKRMLRGVTFTKAHKQTQLAETNKMLVKARKNRKLIIAERKGLL